MTIHEKQEIQEFIEKNAKEKLYEGQVFKNKAELKKALGIEEPSSRGNSLYIQNEIIDTVLKYEKIPLSNKIQITEIYEVPEELVDNRCTGGNSRYVKFIEVILLNILIREKNKDMSITYSQLYEDLGMRNKNYTDKNLRWRLQKVDHRMTKWEVTNFFIRSYSIMKRTIRNALNSLQSRGLIKYHERTIIVKHDRDEKGFVTKTEKWVATKDDMELILEEEDNMLHKMGYYNKAKVFLAGKSEVFYDRVKQELYENYEWDNYYDEIYMYTAPKGNLQRALEEDIIRLNKMELNEKIRETIDLDAQHKYERQERMLAKMWEDDRSKINDEKKLEAHDLITPLDVYKMVWKSNHSHFPDDYIDIQEKLSRFFISIVPEDQRALLDYIDEMKENNIIIE